MTTKSVTILQKLQLRVTMTKKRWCKYMSKYKRNWNQSKYEEYIANGRGQGEGPAYLPWLTVHSFSSNGIITRIYGYKSKRVHHLLSRNELYYFYLLEWSEKVEDIREQYPLLDVELAIDIASKAGIKYPRDNVSGFPYILTCDFMITTRTGLQARTIKTIKDLSNKRVLEKLEIERRYWKTCNVEWRIVTENEIATEKAKRIEWIYTSAELPESLSGFEYRKETLHQLTSKSISQTAEWLDKQYDFPGGSGLRMIKHLLWTKQIPLELIKI